MHFGGPEVGEVGICDVMSDTAVTQLIDDTGRVHLEACSETPVRAGLGAMYGMIEPERCPVLVYGSGTVRVSRRKALSVYRRMPYTVRHPALGKRSNPATTRAFKARGFGRSFQRAGLIFHLSANKLKGYQVGSSVAKVYVSQFKTSIIPAIPVFLLWVAGVEASV
ncbi:hypothetical protein B0H11DRAFT_1905839 [Mycena galericulata]|nr:hypothetical protein B0H11DRAFT_1905839 [Mycena galericulata]